MTKLSMIKTSDLKQAILNWQNTIGSTLLDGQLEAFVGTSLGSLDYYLNNKGYYAALTDEQADRIRALLGENHPIVIKVWLARNK